MDAYEIIQYIGDAKKQTPVKVTLKGQLKEVTFPETIKVFNNCKTGTLFGDWADVKPFLEANKEKIEDYVVENDARNSAIPFLDLKDINARIEPGALIREKVEIGDQAVIMMGAILNIGAGTVLAGVIEPPSAAPVVIENEVVIGANAVVLEGVRVGEGAVVAAGAVVVEDVPAHTVVAGVPAKVIKQIDDKTKSKTEILEELRKL
ncbi:DapH/DapD/GlmU-related protein [Enterococcus faecalis]|uniref:DapH/DapD/GlmU-related protein n=1 Tax=Enterococcus faecalis TaxID=1351 RepID=UPI0019256A62